MNTRDYKTFAPGEYYHVFNRGVGKMEIFKDEDDYKNLLKRLNIILGITQGVGITQGGPLRIKPLDKNSFDLVAYCLMPNHYHFLIKQNNDDPISILIAKLFTSYSMYFNRKYNRVGTLFQDVFKAVRVDNNEYLMWLSAYIHQNPAVAGITWDLKNWKWSSYGEYLEGGEGLCSKDIILGQFKTKQKYQKFVDDTFDILANKKQIEKGLFLD